ncbi:MAG: DUF2142 domain-containing protein [Oscillospiraceae bacterium]|nr:DUF2142 domain-containing protein [Oscillospiraceae bacterium]
MLKKSNIFALLIIIIPLLLIGASNYFFAASSYRFIIDPITEEKAGRYWSGDIDGVIMALTMCLFVTAAWIPAAKFGWIDKLCEHITNRFKYYKIYVRENRRKLLIHIGILILILVAAFAVDFIYSFFSPRGLGNAVRRTAFFMTIGLSGYFMYIFRGKPEKLFFSISTAIGLLYVITHPMLFFGLDNEMHWAWAVEESYILNVSVVQSDLTLARTFQTGYFGWLPSGEDNAVVYSFPKGADTLTWVGNTSLRSLYYRISHIPMGLVIYFGRSLVLSPNIILWMVMFGSHLLYTTVVYFAIKRLNSGKYLMAAIALAPLTFLVSTTVGYDHWLKAFLLLGFAYYFHEIQTPDEKIKLKNIVIMIGAFVIGLSPKAIYFPVMLVLYFIRKSKFNSSKEYKIYLAAVTGLVLFVVASFMIPYFTTGGTGYEDIRAGENISASGQVRFILQNPLTYAGILLNFLKDYLNMFSNERFITWYISYGHSSFPNFTMFFIMFIALTDRSEKDRFSSTISNKIKMIIILFATVALYTTSMYIAFSEVGASVINGIQKRYLIPLLFPFFYAVLSFNIENKINKTAYSSCVFGFMAFILLYGAWNTFLP